MMMTATTLTNASQIDESASNAGWSEYIVIIIMRAIIINN